MRKLNLCDSKIHDFFLVLFVFLMVILRGSTTFAKLGIGFFDAKKIQKLTLKNFSAFSV